MDYCLALAGLAIAIAGVVVAAVANLPGDRGGASPRWRDPDAWLNWLAIGLAVAWLVGARPAAFGERVRPRIWAGVAMVTVCAAGLALVLVRMPERGIDLSFPLTALGFALGLLGALLLLLVRGAGDRRPASGAARWLVRGTAVAVAASLSVGLAAFAVPKWVVAANTEATTDEAVLSYRVSTLDGMPAWRIGGVGEDAHILSTTGGLAVLDERGGRVLDAASGRERWSFRRWDVNGHISRRDPLSVAVGVFGRWLAMTYRVDAPRLKAVDDRRHRDGAWVFDVTTGRMRADVPIAADSRPMAVTGQRILLSVPGGPDLPEDGRVLASVDFNGGTAWRYNPGKGCAPSQVSEVGDGFVVLVGCGQNHSLVRLDGRTGAAAWTWTAGQFGGDPGEHGHRLRRQDMVLALAGDIAVADVRVTYEMRQDGTVGEITGGEVWHNLFGIRLTDGTRVWERRDQHYGDLPNIRPAGASGVLRATVGTAILAVQHESGDSRDRRQAIALRGFNAATGEPAWSVDLPGSALSANYRNDSVALLADGRLVLTYRDLTAASGLDHCAVGAWDTATGARRADLRLRRTAPETTGNRCSESFPIEVGGSVALLVPQRGLVMLR